MTAFKMTRTSDETMAKAAPLLSAPNYDELSCAGRALILVFNKFPERAFEIGTIAMAALVVSGFTFTEDQISDGIKEVNKGKKIIRKRKSCGRVYLELNF